MSDADEATTPHRQLLDDIKNMNVASHDRARLEAAVARQRVIVRSLADLARAIEEAGSGR
jgi:hypothetical protein